MLIRSLLLSIVFTFSLFAAPNIAQIKAAVEANPALLDTPQAQAAMAQHSINSNDVRDRLDTNSSITVAPVLNNINFDTNNSGSNVTNKILEGNLRKINPFAYKTSKQITKELSKKQQRELVKHKLVRYSSKFFVNKNVINSTSLPTPNNYIITNGDTLSIYVYGDRNKQYTPTVNNDGTIELPFLGPVSVGGMKFKDAKKHLIQILKTHYKLSDFYINMKKYSTIQVTLVGDVKAPGLYNLASFSTIKDLLLASKGLNPTASVRNLIIKRKGKVIAKVDFYDLLFKAKAVNKTILKFGDIVVVKQAKKLASVDGYVNNAAIFELKKGETLSTLIGYAGGMKPDASKRNIKVKRYFKNSQIKTYTVTYAQAKKFKVINGDKVYIYPLDYSAEASVNIYGNIIRPGSYNLPKSQTLNALLRENVQHSMKKFFLPQTYFQYALLKRYNDGLNYETKSLNLLDIISNKTVVKLKPQDEIYIFSKNDIFANSYVTTKGKDLLHGGKLQYYNGMTVKDAINASGISGVLDNKVRVTTFYTSDFMPKTKFYSLKQAGDVKLNPYDVVEVFDYYDIHILQPVTISGQVIKPTTVYYEKGMNLKKLIEMAGGLTKKAYTKEFEIVRYSVDANQTRQRRIIQENLFEKSFADIKLKPYDEVKIFTIPKWNERKTVTLKGQVRFPGTYPIETGEKLAHVIKRAGGFTKQAFLQGAVFTRESVRENQMRQYNQTLARLKRELALFNAMPANAKNAPTGNTMGTLNEVIGEAKKYQPVGRVSISLDSNLTAFAKSDYNVVLKNGDSISIPSTIDTVTVFGEVFNPTSFVYNNKLDSEDYIKLASGFTKGADADRVYVIHADGTSEPVVSGWGIFKSYASIQKGDTIVVPLYIQEYNNIQLWESVSKIMAGFAVTIATLNTIGIF